MNIQYEKSAIKFLKALQKPIRGLIQSDIQKLTHEPPEGDIKKMQGYTDGTMRLRVGKYRVLFRYEYNGTETILKIINVGSRGDIYK